MTWLSSRPKEDCKNKACPKHYHHVLGSTALNRITTLQAIDDKAVVLERLSADEGVVPRISFRDLVEAPHITMHIREQINILSFYLETIVLFLGLSPL